MATLYYDVCGSIPRRAEQAKKDEAELARPVRSAFSGGAQGTYLNLRSVEERVAARVEEHRTPEEIIERVDRRHRPARAAARARKARRGWR